MDLRVSTAARQVLLSSQFDFAGGFLGVPLQQQLHMVFYVKQKVCGSVCGPYMPRHDTRPKNRCGKCQEVVRDVSITWAETSASVKLKQTAWKVLEGTCERVQMRHSPSVSETLTEYCDGFVEDHGRAIVSAMLSSRAEQASADQSNVVDYWTTSALLGQALCEDETQHCKPGAAESDVIPKGVAQALLEQTKAQELQSFAEFNALMKARPPDPEADPEAVHTGKKKRGGLGGAALLKRAKRSDL